MNKSTTKFVTVLDSEFQEMMNGREEYQTIGYFFPINFVPKIIKKFDGLNLYFSCIDKAIIVYRMAYGFSIIHGLDPKELLLNVGEIEIHSPDYFSSYQFLFNPPFEFHSWVTYRDKIIDFALPGAILAGLKARDEKGAILWSRDPIILNGAVQSEDCPSWIDYRSKERWRIVSDKYLKAE